MRLRRPIVGTVLFTAIVALAALSLGRSSVSRADEPAAPPAVKPLGPNEAELSIVAETLYSDVLRSLARITGFSITWSDGDKAVTTKKFLGTATTIRGSVDHIFDSVRAMLVNAEIVLTKYGPSENQTYIAMDARTLASQFILKAQPDAIEISDAMIPKLMSQGGRFVAATIRVTNLTELRDVRTALQRVITQNNIGSVQEVPAARAFMITDFAPNVAIIYRMIRQMDVVPTPAPMADAKKTAPAYFVLKHGSAPRAAVLLKDLFFAKPVTPVAPSTQPGIAPPAPAADASPRISYDEATNQVVVIANADDVETMREIIRHVDVEPTAK